MTDQIKVYAWADYSWYYKEDIEDIDMFLFNFGKSDDYIIISLPEKYTEEESISKYITNVMDNKT